MSRWAVVLVAGGSGRRFGSDIPKQFLHLGGRPLIEWSIRVFSGFDDIVERVVVLPPAEMESPDAWTPPAGWLAVPGGTRRQDSVLAGLSSLRDSDMVLIHDAARPLVSPDCVNRVMEMAERTGAAVPVIPVRDTVKRLGDTGTVNGTLPRDELALSQTPQGYDLGVLSGVLASADDVTDECAAMEASGRTVHAVPGERMNFKITDPQDLALAGSLKGYGPERRMGTGLDFHPFSESRPLILGGLHLERSGGLAGHSDGDALLHAVADAILAAARMGDIGQHFPPGEPAWEGADSAVLLTRARDMVLSGNWTVEQVDVTVVAERPRILPIRDALIDRISEILAVPRESIWVKGTTTNTLGDIGAGKGLCCLAHAVLRRDGPLNPDSGPPK